MRKIAIVNRKGGVAKTTTAVNLAAALVEAERNVLVIDTDTQAHCSRLLGVKPEKGLAELLDGAPAKDVVTEARPGIFLIAGSMQLAGAARLIAREDVSPQLVLKKALAPYEGRFDFVLVDTQPGYSPVNVNVLFYCREILSPISMELLAVDGFVNFLGELSAVQAEAGISLRYVLPTFADGRVKKSAEILEQLQQRFGDLVCNPIRYSVKLSEAFGETIFEFAPKDRSAVDYAMLAGKVLRDG